MRKQPEPESPKKSDVVVINILPGTDPDTLELLGLSHKAVILIGFAMGSIPSDLNLTIKELTKRGIPVFIVSDNPGTDHGYIRVVDNVQRKNLAAGAIPIEKVNVNRLQEVLNAIQDEIDAGKCGAELAEAVRLRFAYGPDEKKPVPEWETPAGRREILKRRREARAALKRELKAS